VAGLGSEAAGGGERRLGASRATLARRRFVARVMVVVTVAAVVVGAPEFGQAQVARAPRLAVGAGPTNPNQTVGNQNQTAQLLITNAGGGSAANDAVVFSSTPGVTPIVVNPSCSIGTAPCPAGFNEGAATIDTGAAAATGQAGTACAGVTFSVTGPDANGNYTFTPNSNFTLAPAEPGPNPLSTCVINFTFDVNNRPADGSTFMTSFAQGNVITGTNGPPTGETAGGQGSTAYAIAQANVLLTTAATSTGTTPGSTTTDTATVTGTAGGPFGALRCSLARLSLAK